MVHRNCGSCRYFGKLKNDSVGGGICDRFDYRTKTDRKCTAWKGIKYNRIMQGG